MTRYLISLLMALFVAMSAMATEQGRLLVSFSQLNPTGGELVVALYRRGQDWLETDKAFRRQVIRYQGDELRLEFPGLPFDDYGLYAFDDKNGNGKFDMRWFPWPKPAEGVGLSNNVIPSGPPDYQDAVFRFARDGQQLNIKMKYY